MDDPTEPAGLTEPADPPERGGPSGWELAYELLLGLLAVVTVATLFVTGPWASLVNWSIYAIFVADFVVRLRRDHEPRTFPRRNWLDLVALIPFELFRPFRTIRLLRLVRLLRAFRLLHRVGPTTRGVLRQNGLGYVLVFTSVLIIAGGTGVALLEDGIGSWGDGMWWALVTTTTVGYGDLAPVDAPGRLIAVVLMVAGIGTLGMITGSIATYFTTLGDERLPTDVRYVRQRLAEWPTMSHAERLRLSRLLDHIVEDEEHTAAASSAVVDEGRSDAATT